MRALCRETLSTLGYVIANPRGVESESCLPEIDQERKTEDTDPSLGERKYGTPKDCIMEVGDAFVRLDDEHKQEVIAFITARLKSYESYTHYRNEASDAVVAISASISEIAKHLTMDEHGNKITTGFETAISLLTKLATDEPTVTRNRDQYASMRFACTVALWDLDFGDTGFWVTRLDDKVTRDFTIGRLLEMPPTVNPDAHGWRLLQLKLPSLGLDIARHTSMKKFDFIVNAIVKGKEIEPLDAKETAPADERESESANKTICVPVEALRAAALVTLPRFITDENHPDYAEDAKYQEAWLKLGVIITHLSELRTVSPDMAELSSSFQFITGGHVAFTTYADVRQFQGAYQTIHIYNKNKSLNTHLVTLILEAGAEMIETYKDAKDGIEADVETYRDSLVAQIGPDHVLDEALIDKERERLTAIAHETRYNAIFILSKIHESGITVPGLTVKKIEEKEKPGEDNKKSEGKVEKKETAGEGSENTEAKSKGEKKGKKERKLVTVFGIANHEGEVELWKV